ncbi:YhfG family protein [Pseudomonas fildesensis]|uniref:YhfG family protein n=1 Tax=Pseudomonas fildesensis TaxID=1674920 RepID=UPI0009E2E922|nr:YhfG family protein [Pseudomonas fildesensis]
MEETTVKHKQAHYKKIQRSNYLASLRLDGFDTQPADVDNPLPTREAVLAKYRTAKMHPTGSSEY